jgi:hypothetical protein
MPKPPAVNRRFGAKLFVAPRVIPICELCSQFAQNNKGTPCFGANSALSSRGFHTGCPRRARTGESYSQTQRTRSSDTARLMRSDARMTTDATPELRHPQKHRNRQLSTDGLHLEVSLKLAGTLHQSKNTYTCCVQQNKLAIRLSRIFLLFGSRGLICAKRVHTLFNGFRIRE